MKSRINQIQSNKCHVQPYFSPFASF